MMVDELVETVKQLNQTNEKIAEIIKQWTVLKHEYRLTKDPMLRLDIKKKWDILQKKKESLEKNRRKIIRRRTGCMTSRASISTAMFSLISASARGSVLLLVELDNVPASRATSRFFA